jgi:hypothetical protein
MLTMGLVAVLSNTQTEDLFQRLTRRDWRQVRRSARPRNRSRDGKLKYGTVSGATLAVLAEAGRPLRYIEIQSKVELLLGQPVPKSSVKHLLHLEARRHRQRIERVGRGLYRLADH